MKKYLLCLHYQATASQIKHTEKTILTSDDEARWRAGGSRVVSRLHAVLSGVLGESLLYSKGGYVIHQLLFIVGAGYRYPFFIPRHVEGTWAINLTLKVIPKKDSRKRLTGRNL